MGNLKLVNVVSILYNRNSMTMVESSLHPCLTLNHLPLLHHLINLTMLLNFYPECMEYLGIKSAPSGNQELQFHSSITTAKLGARTLDTNPFGRYHAKFYFNTHLNPKLYYPFTCSFLSNQQYIDINKAHILSTLSSMGFNRT